MRKVVIIFLSVGLTLVALLKIGTYFKQAGLEETSMSVSSSNAGNNLVEMHDEKVQVLAEWVDEKRTYMVAYHDSVNLVCYHSGYGMSCWDVDNPSGIPKGIQRFMENRIPIKRLPPKSSPSH